MMYFVTPESAYLHDVFVRLVEDAGHVLSFHRVYVNQEADILYLADEHGTTTVIPMRSILIYEKKKKEEGG